MRLKRHPGSGRDVQDLIGREDSSAAQAEDAKFETGQGFIIDPAAVAGPRGNPGDAKAATPREARFGVTRRFAPRQPEDAEAGVTRWKHREARLEERSGGATRSSSYRQRRRMRDAGQPETPSLAQPEGAEAGATWRKHREARLKERGRGATRRISPTAALKDGKRGATRGSIAGTAGMCGSWGNPAETRGGEAWQSKDSGRPGELPPAAPKDARREATRRRIAGTAEERTARGNLGDAQPEALEDAAAGQPGDAKPAQPEDHWNRGSPELGSQGWMGRSTIR